MKNRIDPLITISLDEYNELLEFKEVFKKAFDEKKTILFNDTWFPGHSGYAINRFTIVNESQLVDDLKNKILQLNSKNEELRREIAELKTKKESKRWF